MEKAQSKKLHTNKKGIRALGIAESFRRDNDKSALVGIVMRSDFNIDGVSFTKISVGGMDATEGVLRIFEDLQRADINVTMLNGCVISWFNIIDIKEVYKKTEIPIICVTYEASEGLKEHIAKHFSGEERDNRIEMYKRLGSRVSLTLNNHELLVRFLGMEKFEANAAIKKFSSHGKVPEPLRVAKIVARAALRFKAFDFTEKY